MEIEYKGWAWLYSVYGYSLVEDAVALFDGGWRPEDKEDLIREYEFSEDEADKYVDVFERLVKDKAYERESNNPYGLNDY